jgi:hypothetical protein
VERERGNAWSFTGFITHSSVWMPSGRASRPGVDHDGAVGLLPAQPDLLEDVLGLRHAPEHAVGDAAQAWTQLQEGRGGLGEPAVRSWLFRAHTPPGTGLVGSKLVTNLREHGHETAAAAPSTGVNTLTGEGRRGGRGRRAPRSEGSLVPGDDAILGEIRYRDWPGRIPAGR